MPKTPVSLVPEMPVIMADLQSRPETPVSTRRILRWAGDSGGYTPETPVSGSRGSSCSCRKLHLATSNSWGIGKIGLRQRKGSWTTSKDKYLLDQNHKQLTKSIDRSESKILGLFFVFLKLGWKSRIGGESVATKGC